MFLHHNFAVSNTHRFYASLTSIIMENHIGGRDPLRAIKPGYLSCVLLSDATETNNVNAGLKKR